MKNDTISKAAVVSEIESIVDTMSVCMNMDECKGMRRMKKTVLERIEALPPTANINVATTDTISRQAAINLFEKYGAEDDAISLLNSLPPALSDWIQCTPETMPKETGSYLVTIRWDGGGYYTDLFTYDTRWGEWREEERIFGTVVAWQPKPQPWKGEQDGI